MSAQLRPPVSERDHIQGPDTAAVTLVEFGDYECPFCGRAEAVVKALQEQLGDRLRYVFRHFPLANAHPHALLAAEAAEASGAQGRFWEMHDLLFENQEALEPVDVARYAASLELDLDRFQEDVNQHRFRDRIRQDLRSGAVSGVNGTPTFFINGYRYDGSHDFESMMAALTGGPGRELGI